MSAASAFLRHLLASYRRLPMKLRLLVADACHGGWRRRRRPPAGAPVVEEFSYWATCAAWSEAVALALAEAGIPFAARPQGRGGDTLIVSAADRAGLGDLVSGLQRQGWSVRQGHRPQREVAVWTVGLWRPLYAPGGLALTAAADAVRIEVWEPVDGLGRSSPEGVPWPPGTLVEDPAAPGDPLFFLPDTWSAATARPDHRSPEAAHRPPTRVGFPVDIVYTWVDGDDPAWRERRRRADPGARADEFHQSALTPRRFTSHDELRYSLRSVDMYADWVNRIWLVTDRQVPPWLRLDHPRLTVVDHRQIFSDPTVLPVFNSHAIESQLHHIPGLAEHYLYLNDDFFFGRPVPPEAFFHANGLAKLFPTLNAPIDPNPRSLSDHPVTAAAKRGRELLDTAFGVTVQDRFKHIPYPQLKSVLSEMEDRWPDIFAETARHRFRHPDDHSIPSSLHQWYSYVTGRAVPGDIPYHYRSIFRADIELTYNWLLRARPFDTFCLNETDRTGQQPELIGLLERFLTAYFPLPSRYERRR